MPLKRHRPQPGRFRGSDGEGSRASFHAKCSEKTQPILRSVCDRRTLNRSGWPRAVYIAAQKLKSPARRALTP